MALFRPRDGMRVILRYDSDPVWHERLIIRRVDQSNYITYTPDRETLVESWTQGHILEVVVRERDRYLARCKDIHTFAAAGHRFPSPLEFMDLQAKFKTEGAITALGGGMTVGNGTEWWEVGAPGGEGIRAVVPSEDAVSMGQWMLHRRKCGDVVLLRFGRRGAISLPRDGARGAGSSVGSYGPPPPGLSNVPGCLSAGPPTLGDEPEAPDEDELKASAARDVLLAQLHRAAGLGAGKEDKLMRLAGELRLYVDRMPSMREALSQVGWAHGGFEEAPSVAEIVARVKLVPLSTEWLCMGEGSIDARVLSLLRQPDHVRRRSLKESLPEYSETGWSDWPISGPRTALDVLRRVCDGYGDFLSRHSRFVSEGRLDANASAVKEHSSLCQVLHLLVSVDQVNIPETASGELLLRKLQLIELFFEHKFCPADTSAAGCVYGDSQLYTGMTSIGRGSLCISPALRRFVAREHGEEIKLLETRRKIGEERKAAAKGGGKGAKVEI